MTMVNLVAIGHKSPNPSTVLIKARCEARILGKENSSFELPGPDSGAGETGLPRGL